MLGMVTCIEDSEQVEEGTTSKTKRTWTYSLHDNFDRATLLTMAGREPNEPIDYLGSLMAMNRKAQQSAVVVRSGKTNGKGAMWVHDV